MVRVPLNRIPTNKVKIFTNEEGAVTITVNGNELKEIVGINVDIGLDDNKVTVEMYADVEIETEAIIYARIDGQKYKIEKV